ncbi:MAG TPA: hypothetical protein VIL49_10765, partial [Capillimicrobium sp.]
MGRLERVAAWVARRPAPVLAAVVLLSVLGGALAALTLRPSTGTDTLVGRSSDSWEATARYHMRFGQDAVYVLVRQDLVRTLLTEDLQAVLGLEGCLAGNVPSGVVPPGGPDGPCGRLAETKPVQVVYGPGTFINESVRQISDQFTQLSTEARAKGQQAAQTAREVARRAGMTPEATRAFVQQAQDAATAPF